jgi:hypothetical protein
MGQEYCLLLYWGYVPKLILRLCILSTVRKKKREI